MSAAIMIGRSAFVCFCLRQVVALWDAGSAAIMIGRSAFVFCLRQVVALWDAVSAAMMIGRSVFVFFFPSSIHRFLDVMPCRDVNVWIWLVQVRSVF